MQPYKSDIDDNEWSSNSSPPSYIQQLPEIVKLILASLFVALVVHAYFTARRNKINNDQRGPGVINGRVGAIGKNSISVRDDTIISVEKTSLNDLDNSSNSINEGKLEGNGQVLGSIQSETNAAQKKKEKVFRKNDVANRNYDALVCKKLAEGDEEGNQDQTMKASSGSNVKKNHDKSNENGQQSDTKNTSTPANDGQSNNDNDDEPADETTPTEQPITPHTPPPMELKSQAKHPGLQGYYNWHTNITSLYRIYAIPSYNGNGNDQNYNQAVLPMHPSSERGNVSLYIEVTNRTSHHKIDVYWIDYKGNEIHKGSIPNRGGVWTQTTYIGHPWTFRTGPGEENVLLKYAPFRVIPSITGAETTSRLDESNGGNVVEGVQKFVLRDVPEDHATQNGGLRLMCWVDDQILPEPPLIPTNNRYHSTSDSISFREMKDAIQWSCQQIQREDAIYQGNGIASAKRILQYLKNICLHPDDPKYRRLRLGNQIFQQTVYNTGARGVLLALGFEELYGYMECGPGGGRMLGSDRIQQISDAMMVVNETLKVMEGNISGNGSDAVLAQPEGGDGFGRAGFGHAGGMNL